MSPARLRHLTWSRVGVAVCVGLIAFGAVVAAPPPPRHDAVPLPMPRSREETAGDRRLPTWRAQELAAQQVGRAVRHRLRHDRSGASRRATWPPRPPSLRGWWCPTTWWGRPPGATEDRRTTVVLDPPGQPVAERGDTVAVIVTGIMTVTSDSGPPQTVPVAERITLHRLDDHSAGDRGASGWRVVGVEVGA